MDMLIHISHQLSNSTTPVYTPAEFTVSPGIASVNVLFFLSLALVLIDAFLAMLVKSWLQEFDRSWRKHTVADLRAQERERRLQALEHWKLAELVTLLPILIQISLLFFCIGLIVLLFPIHLISAIFSSVALVAGLAFYLFTTYVSIIDAHSPFPSLISHGLIIPFRTSRSSLHLEHEANKEPMAQSLPSDDSLLPQGTMGVEKPATITRSHSQIDPQIYVNIFERLVATTAEGVENIPIFLDLLDQPVKDPRLRPSSVDKWKELFRTTLGLLGDLSTFSDSAAHTIICNALFCYDGGSADQQLVRNLIHHFDAMCSGQTSKHKPLNSLFALYLCNYCGIGPFNPWKLSDTIAFLEPSNAADAELLWMVNTIHNGIFWKHSSSNIGHNLPGIFVALLTYVSCTEQSRRSQVPLTAAIIYAIHTIKSALDKGGIHFITGPYVLPGTVLTTSESMSMSFHQIDTLDLWSKDCVEHASTLLQPNPHWVGSSDDDVWRFQLALIAALYIDSTKQASQAAAAFADLLRKVTDIPVKNMTTWGWADAYDQTKLAGYLYMVVFQKPIYERHSEKSPVQDIRHIITETISNYSKMAEMRLSALHLLDFSIKYCTGKSSSLSNLLTIEKHGALFIKLADRDFEVVYGPFDPWFLLHLDTLFSPGCTLHQRDIEQLEWTDSPEQVHIAIARLALYNSLQGEEDRETKWLKPEPDLLKLFLKSKDYAVCTGAFRCCLNLASRPSTSDDIQGAEIFIPGIMGSQWIEHLIGVLCLPPWYHKEGWEFLAEHLTTKWATLPLPWCCDFASSFLFLNVHPLDEDELPVYQWFANCLRYEEQPNQAFLPFLGMMLELIIYRMSLGQLNSLDTWLVHLPAYLENQDAHVKLENVLAMRKQEIVDETLRCFAELPMTYPE